MRIVPFFWISNQVWFPFKVDPKFMDKLPWIKREISKSLDNLMIFLGLFRAKDK